MAAEMGTLLYRPLLYKDKPGMQALCKECFPINYPDRWYDNVLRNRDFYTLGVFDNDSEQMVGMIVGHSQDLIEAENETGTLLETLIENDKALYIVIFGVLERYRRMGVGSALMDDLIKYAEGLQSIGQSNGSMLSANGKPDTVELSASESDQLLSKTDQSNAGSRTVSNSTTRGTTRVIYLHVESTNNVAITFYEKKQFSYFSTIYGYYQFERNTSADGLVYVMCVNNGRIYGGGLGNWCRRHIPVVYPVIKCFKEACEGTIELVKNALN